MELPLTARTQIETYLRTVDARLPGVIEAVWVGGSIALRDFHQGLSDIDLFLLTNRELRQEEKISPSWCSRLQVEWLSKTKLVDYSQRGDLEAITAATLHRSGLVLRGPEPASLIADVEHQRLAECTLSNLGAYWVPWLKKVQSQTIERFLALHPERIQWGVFGVPRQYVTIKEGRIVSKSEGASYVREIFEPRWHRIIDEALRLRNKQGEGLYSSPFARRQEMISFVEYAIEQTLRLT